ncbi:hypothetical protein K488DRAFT_76293 [Vararia minispora EC-137]|uniref:Uncharacterized protein n=1 Tax=Vararia minispora EC-137 TaxID=1314806 RepID=A0ACB8QVW7_9AGAM|nr:hypothetical protein K488DRAFT_76293 [Vararia minispora EC-137]
MSSPAPSPLASPAPEAPIVDESAPAEEKTTKTAAKSRATKTKTSPRKAAEKKTATTTKKAVAPKKTAKAAAAIPAEHPPFKDIIKECIVDSKDRTGVSRSTIKKYAEEKYKLDLTGTRLSQLNKAIVRGVDDGIFVLPKGPSGKVKLAPKTKPATETKEVNALDTHICLQLISCKNAKPAASKKTETATTKKATTAKKSAAVTKAKKPVTTATAAKKPAAKAPGTKKPLAAVKKATTAPKKVAATKRTATTTRKASSAKSDTKKAWVLSFPDEQLLTWSTI